MLYISLIIVMVCVINNLNYLYINIYYLVFYESEYYKNIYRTLDMQNLHGCYEKLSWLMPNNRHNFVVVNTNNKNGGQNEKS